MYPDFHYNTIHHVYKNNFYVIDFKNKNEVIFAQYNPITKISKEHDISSYYDSSNQKVIFYIDLIDDHWFLFSSKGVFMFDTAFENEKQLLDESIFETTYNFTSKDNRIILETIN